MDRRLLIRGLFGLAGAAAVAAVLPQAAQAGIPPVGPKPEPGVLPDLEELQANPEALPEEGVQPASHRRRHHRRYRRRRHHHGWHGDHRWRRRRWRRVCRSYWHNGRWRRRCRRRPYWVGF